MKSTGVTRRIDELGRVVIPKEIRKNLGIRDGESLEIYTSDELIILKKHSEVGKFEDLGNKLCELISKVYKVNSIITDREKVVADSYDKKLIGSLLNQELINLIDNRQSYESSEYTSINFNNNEVKGYITIMPIIESIDSLGLIVIICEQHEEMLNLAKLMAQIMSEKINIS